MAAPSPSAKRPLAQLIQDALPVDANGRSKRRRIKQAPSRRSETVFRILCHASKTGNIIGKGGSVVKSIRDETGTMIRIEEPVPGCDERVVTICSKERAGKPRDEVKEEVEDPVDYLPESDDEIERENAQKAYGQHTRNDGEDRGQIYSENKCLMAREDGKRDEQSWLKDGSGEGNNKGTGQKDDGVREARGEEAGGGKAKDVTEAENSTLSPIQEALLRVHLRITEEESPKHGETHEKHSEDAICTRLLVPTSQVGCLLGMKGKIVQRMQDESGAEIRILPRDKLPRCAAPLDEVVQITGDLIAVRKALLAASSQLQKNPPKRTAKEFDLHEGGRLPSVDTENSAGYRGPPGPFLPGSDAPSIHEVVFRILCSKEKIGGLIGRGGRIVQSLREETGAKISIDVSSSEGDERVVRISALENLEDPYSNSQKALMIVHSKIANSGSGLITTKLLVPANQAGCLIGKGGSVMVEMKRSTRAKIRIYGKEHLPPCALPNDELVEIAGNASAIQKALLEIASRLRENLAVEKSCFALPADIRGFPLKRVKSYDENFTHFGGTISGVPTSGSYRSPFPDVPTGAKVRSFGSADALTSPQNFGPNTRDFSEFGWSTRDSSRFGLGDRDIPSFSPSSVRRDFLSFSPSSSARDFRSVGRSLNTTEFPGFGTSSSTRDFPGFGMSSSTRDFPTLSPSSSTRGFPSFGPSLSTRDFPSFRPTSSTRDFPSFSPSSRKDFPSFGSSANTSDVPSFGSSWDARDIPSFGYNSYADKDLSRINARSVVTSETVEVTIPEHVTRSLIGENGRNLAQIREVSGAKVAVNLLPPGTSETTVEITGTPDQTHTAQSLLQAFILSAQ